MTPTTRLTDTPARRDDTTRFSASSRPIPRAPANDKPAGWLEPAWATTVARAKITVTVVAILALVVLLVAAPPTVTIPLAAVLFTGLLVAALFSWMEWLTRPDRRARGVS